MSNAKPRTLLQLIDTCKHMIGAKTQTKKIEHSDMGQQVVKEL